MPHLLLVEDNPLHVRLVRSMLAEVWPGFDNLGHATRLDAALEYVVGHSPDCVLLDLMLPDAGGLESVNAMLAAVPDIPVVVLSAHDDDEAALHAVREGAQDYLVKGAVGADGLAKAIRFAIQRHRSAVTAAEIDGLTEESVGVGVLDLQGKILQAEPGVAEMVGRELSDFIGLTIEDLCGDVDVQRWRRAVTEMAESDANDASVTLHLRHGAGHAFRVRMELTAISDGTGEVSGYVSRYIPLGEEGTGSSGGSYAVVLDWQES